LAPQVEKRDTVMVETSPFPQPQKVKEVVFSPLCVCLSVCVKDISKSLGRIRMKLCGQVRNITRTNWFDFGEDPNQNVIFFSVILHHWEIGLKNTAQYLRKLWTNSDETWWTGSVCRKEELFDFDEYPNPNLDTIII